MDLKKPLTLDEQIQRLQQHNMIVYDPSYAKEVLKEVNYYRFTGYAFQFKDEDNPDDYQNGTNFNDIVKLYMFDAELRCILKKSLDSIELYARSKIAYEFSLIKCCDPPHDQHYCENNFYNSTSYNQIIKTSLNREKENSKDALFVIHHENHYQGKMPLWVIVELLSFTNLSKLYSAMYIKEQEEIAKSMGTSPSSLKNHLHCLANLRNKVAHAGRLYNATYNPPAILGREYLRKNEDVSASSLFAYILILMRRLPQVQQKEELFESLLKIVAECENCIDLSLINFPVTYKKNLQNEIK